MKRLINKISSSFKKSKPKHNVPLPFFTKDILIANYIRVGDYTYGVPKVLQWGENAKLEIGKYCSIAEEVKIFLGGNHRVDWITTYPFNSIELFSIEAMSFGLPVITADSGAISEIVINNVNGIVVEPFNIMQHADAFIQLADNGLLRADMGKAARERVRKHFTLQQEKDTLFEILELE